MTRRETSAEIEAKAADWAVRVDGGPLDAAGQAELDTWLGGDIRRRGSFARAQAMLIHAERARALGSAFDPDHYIVAHGETAPETARAAELPTRRRFLMWTGSATAVAASGVGAIWLGFGMPSEAYATMRGEVRLVPLSDGSQMTLNTASRAEVRFSRNERRVVLTDGEALFDVAKDAARPFYVMAGDIEVRAVGTSFTVRHLGDRPVEVVVREGTVELGSGGDGRRRVAANMIAMASPRGPIRTAELSPGDIGRQLAWREGMLAFEDEPLTRAADEFARYSDRHIRFAEAEVGEQTVTGLFAANNPEGFARAVAHSLGLQAEPVSDGIMLRR